MCWKLRKCLRGIRTSSNRTRTRQIFVIIYKQQYKQHIWAVKEKLITRQQPRLNSNRGHRYVTVVETCKCAVYRPVHSTLSLVIFVYLVLYLINRQQNYIPVIPRPRLFVYFNKFNYFLRDPTPCVVWVGLCVRHSVSRSVVMTISIKSLLSKTNVPLHDQNRVCRIELGKCILF